MPIADWILYQAAKRWPSPTARRVQEFGAEPDSEAYHTAYAWSRFDQKAREGILANVRNKDVLEIGCGHGGVTCYMAACGARKVVGIDLNTRNLQYAQKLCDAYAAGRGGARLPIEFIEMDATQLAFPDASFDVAIADSVFEHFADPGRVLDELRRVLRPDGRIVIPAFSSILSKYGLHLKHGLKMPWSNLFFPESTIVNAMHRLAADRPILLEIYPGLNDNPKKVRDLRRYKDLNDITYGKFRRMAERAGFEVEMLAVRKTRVGRVVSLVFPPVRHTLLMDVLSTGASAILRNPVR